MVMSRSVLISSCLTFLALAGLASTARAECPYGEATVREWLGSWVGGPQVSVAGGRVLATWWSEGARPMASITPGGDITVRAGMPAALPTTVAWVTDGRGHLAYGVDEDDRLVAQRVTAAGDVVGAPLILDTLDSWGTYPHAIADARGFVVAWAHPTGWERWSIQVATIGADDGAPAMHTVARDVSKYAAPAVTLARAGDVTWVLWQALGSPDEAHSIYTTVFGVRLDGAGMPIDAAPVMLGPRENVLAVASLGDEALVVTSSTVGVYELERLGPDGFMGSPHRTDGLAGGYVLGLFAVPALDGYVLWQSSGYDTNLGFDPRGPDDVGGTSGIVLERDGTPRSTTPIASFAGHAPAIAFDGERFVYAVVHEAADAMRGVSEVRAGFVSLAGDVRELAPLAHHELEQQTRTVCADPSQNDGCQVATSPGGGVLLIVACAVCVRRRRRRATS